MNNNYIAVFDFETDSPNPYECNPVELACVMIDPRTLNIINDSEFSSGIRPPSIENEDYVTIHQKTIDFHADVQKKTANEIIATWRANPSQEEVWTNFKNYLLKYHKKGTRKSIFSAPLAAGQNIIGFDIPIITRLSTQYKDLNREGESKIFFPRDIIDLKFICFLWFENQIKPDGFNMKVLRQFFGMSEAGSHTAIQDVRDTAKIISRFLKLHRKFGQHVNFEGAFKDEGIES